MLRRALRVGSLLALAIGATATVSSSQIESSPGPTPRWLVQLASRSFELHELREAIVVAEDSRRALELIAEYERQVEIDRADFVRDATTLGARIVRHWWIVDACHVEATAEIAAQLGVLTGVVRIEPDLAVAGHGGDRALDLFHHGAEFNHRNGFEGDGGGGAILAVMDSGIDIASGSTGRPHRAFFAHGDPSDMSGGGIAGSRIVFNRSFGLLNQDDEHGHGTSVAAIAAGAAWNGGFVSDGHARGARIANYAIGDRIEPNGSIFAFYSTMTSAWQQMLTDRATSPIVAAVNSFGGEPSPTHTVQQALDAAAWVGDILVCVSAGNEGPAASTGGQSCANGIAVGAVREVTHRVEDYSSRGPVLGDTQRNYPDLTAIAWSRVPVRDWDAVGELFGYTSSAAPRVAGAGAVLRAAVSSLRADETKAILLASAAEVAGANPSLDRNAFGLGLSRDDRALATAFDPARHGRGTVTGPGNRQTFGFAVTPGATYRIVVTWMRTLVGTSLWTNLDLSVVDGVSGTPLGSSTSPRNLYESVDVVGPASGLLLAHVDGMLLINGAQQFAIAVAEHSEPGQRGEFETIGAGCAGPRANGDAICLERNPDADPSHFTDVEFDNRTETVIEMLAPAGGLQLSGFELFLRGRGETTLETRVYLDNGNGQPQANPVAIATMPIRELGRWYRSTFAAPVAVPGGQRCFVGVAGFDQTRVTLQGSSAPTSSRVFARDRCTGAGWNGSRFERIGVRALCSDGVRAEVPEHETRGSLVVGSTCELVVDYVPAGMSAVYAIGFSKDIWPGGTLPFDVSMFGGTGCSLRVDPVIVGQAVADPSGTARVAMSIAADPTIVGWTFYSQFLLLDPLSSRALTVSNAGRNRVGIL